MRLDPFYLGLLVFALVLSAADVRGQGGGGAGDQARTQPAPKPLPAPRPAPKPAPAPRPRPAPKPQPPPKPPPPKSSDDERILKQLELYMLYEMLNDYEMFYDDPKPEKQP